MFDINEAFIQALQKQELEENLNYYKEVPNATAADDNEKDREYYGKYMTKRDKVRSLDQAKRNLERAKTDDRVSFGQIVDKVSFENTQDRDLDIYKARKNYAGIYRGEGPKYNKDLTINGKSKLEPTDAHLETADMWDEDAKKIADKIRARHNKKQESASITVTQDVNSEDEALDLVNDTSYFNIGDEVEVKDWNGRIYKVTKTKDYKYKDGKRIEEKLEENNEKTKLTFAYKDNGQFYYKDEKGRVYVDMNDDKDKTDLYRCVGDYDEPSHSVNAEDFELINNPKNDENYERNKKYEYTYMLLSRLVMDCKYYLGNGNRFDGHLWAGSVDKQIAKMKELWNTLPEDMKPEWLSMEDIENYEREMKSEKKTEAEETSDNISFELNTDLLPILNMSQYNLADDIDISREELNNVMSDLGKPIIEKVIKEVLPNATVTAGEFYNPKSYNYEVDQLDFTVSVPKIDYETLKDNTLSKDDFEQFLSKTYKSYDGYISTMPKNIAEFNKAKDWEQFVAILSYYIEPFAHQDDFIMSVWEYLLQNYPTDEEENENIEESKEPLKETDKDMYEKIKSEPRTEKYEDGLKLKDEIIEAWKNKDLEKANNKWEELFNLFSTGYDDRGNKTPDFTEEQAIRDMIELTMITDEIEDKCVYDVTDYGKQKYYKQMGY